MSLSRSTRKTPAEASLLKLTSSLGVSRLALQDVDLKKLTSSSESGGDDYEHDYDQNYEQDFSQSNDEETVMKVRRHHMHIGRHSRYAYTLCYEGVVNKTCNV